MKASKRELAFAERYFHEVRHTTLNPGGPGVVRIHLIPPKLTGNEIEPSVAIINGMDMIPVDRFGDMLYAKEWIKGLIMTTELNGSFELIQVIYVKIF